MFDRVLAVALGILIFLAPPHARGDLHDALLVQVIDGDTIVAQIGDSKEHVRLIGIDTPESRVNDRAHRQAERTKQDLDTVIRLGKRAAEYLHRLLPVGSALKIEFDVERRDRYGRLLAYLYLVDGAQINEKIIAEGYARVYTVPPNVRYVDRLRAAERIAREQHRGIWGE